MSNPDTALALARMHVELSLFDDASLSDQTVVTHCNLAAQVMATHMREAKAELAGLGINLNWSEA